VLTQILTDASVNSRSRRESVLVGVLAISIAAISVPARAQLSVVEYDLPAAARTVTSLTTGPDGNLWFTEFTGNHIGRITVQGAVTEFAIPTADAQALRIASGPDGNLWFTELGANQIGKITPEGIVTEYVLPEESGHQGREPHAITAGPDGNVWFTEEGPRQIGRMTPTGTLSEFAIPSQGLPEAIIAGPDGNVWFAEVPGIGRITPTGHISEFSMADEPSAPNGIAAGRDGNLWFSDANGLGRITVEGTITLYRTPYAGGAGSITAGPDGTMWFQELERPFLGRITLAGAIDYFQLPDPQSVPGALTTGPDGNVWFVDNGTQRIGRFAVPATPTAVPTATPLPTRATGVPQTNVYVTNAGSGTVSVIDAATNIVFATIELGMPSYSVAATPDSTRAYVGASGAIFVVDTVTNAVVSMISDVGAIGLAVSPDGRFAYAVAFAGNRVVVIDTMTNTITASIPVTCPVKIATAPDGQSAYVTSQGGTCMGSGQDTVEVIDLPMRTVRDSIPLSNAPNEVVFSPNGRAAYVTSLGNLFVIDTATRRVIRTLVSGLGGAAFTPDGAKAYAGGPGTTELVIDGATNSIINSIELGRLGGLIAITPDGLRAYITDGMNSVTVVDTHSDTVIGAIQAGTQLQAIAIAYVQPPTPTLQTPATTPTSTPTPSQILRTPTPSATPPLRSGGVGAGSGGCSVAPTDPRACVLLVPLIVVARRLLVFAKRRNRVQPS